MAAQDESPLAHYANYFRIGYNAEEVIVECCQHYAGKNDVHVVTRLIFTPATARQLHSLLADSLQQQAQLAANMTDDGSDNTH